MAALLTFYLNRVINHKIIFPELKQSGILKDILVDISYSRPKAIVALVKVKDKLMYYNIDEIEIVKGEVIPQAKSLSYETMSQSDFDRFYNDVLSIIALDLEMAPEKIQDEIAGFY